MARKCFIRNKELTLDTVIYAGFTQIFGALVVAYVFHLVLRRLGQPSINSQMLAGAVLGTTLIQHIGNIVKYVPWDEDDLSSIATVGRAFFMFLAGLEIDIGYLWRSRVRGATIAFGGAAGCVILGIIFTPLFYGLLRSTSGMAFFGALLVLIFVNTASPILVRLVTELKIMSSETGRLAVSAALINDMTCLVGVMVITMYQSSFRVQSFSMAVWNGAMTVIILVLALLSLRPAVWLINSFNKQQRYIGDVAFVFLLSCIFLVPLGIEIWGYSGMLTGFLMGLVFPRDGPAARTMLDKLSYAVHNIALPVYFCFTGMRMDLTKLANGQSLLVATTLVALSSVGKILGTILTAFSLNIPFREGLVLGLLLNVKGHLDIVILTFGRKHNVWDNDVYLILLLSVFINNVIIGPAAASIVNRERRAYRYRPKSLEWLSLDRELRVLACVHNPSQVPTVLGLLELSSGTNHNPLVIYLMHLVELTRKYTVTALYNERPKEARSEDFGGDNVRLVSAAIDAFARKTSISVRQLTAVSSFGNMHEDVCNGAQDVRASLVLVPFHKELRYDGKMMCRKDGHRYVNLKLVQHAPCTIGIIVDREMTSTVASGALKSHQCMQTAAGQDMHNVIAIFFGGPDDREAVAFACRLSMHPCVSVTILRFLPAGGHAFGTPKSSVNSGFSVKSSETSAMVNGSGQDADEEFMAVVFNDFVATGVATYVERTVEDGPATARELKCLAGLYSLFVLGKERQDNSMTVGLDAWQECSELGVIGDLMASSDFMSTGSILVLQQHNVVRHEQHVAIHVAS